MGLFRPSKRKPKKFGYEPRYYNPKKDKELKRRMRSKRKSRRRSPTSLLYFLALLVLSLFIYNALG